MYIIVATIGWSINGWGIRGWCEAVLEDPTCWMLNHRSALHLAIVAYWRLYHFIIHKDEVFHTTSSEGLPWSRMRNTMPLEVPFAIPRVAGSMHRQVSNRLDNRMPRARRQRWNPTHGEGGAVGRVTPTCEGFQCFWLSLTVKGLCEIWECWHHWSPGNDQT
jgi:hypothetical protein